MHRFAGVGVWACLVQERQRAISRRLIERTKREPVAIELSRQYTGGNVPTRQPLYRASASGVSRQDRMDEGRFVVFMDHSTNP